MAQQLERRAFKISTSSSGKCGVADTVAPVRRPSAFRAVPARQRVLAARGHTSVPRASGAPHNPCHAIVHTVFFIGPCRLEGDPGPGFLIYRPLTVK